MQEKKKKYIFYLFVLPDLTELSWNFWFDYKPNQKF
jgi:hypothetical protein